jgi:hypothetical protein
MRRAASLALLVTALGACGFLVFLARGVGAVEARAGSGAIVEAAEAGVRPPGVGAAGRLARPLLGVDDDESLQRALGLIAAGKRDGVPAQKVLELHAEAVAVLTPIADSDGEPRRRSRAAGLIGALYGIDARLDPAARDRYADQAITRLRQAVELDPANEDAKVNLELYLGEAPPEERPGAGADGGSTFSGGAGASDPGSGY